MKYIPTQWRGATLIEALVAMLVMGLGMLAIAGVSGKLRYSGEYAKQRVEAAHLARAELERSRGFVAISRAADTPADAAVYDELGSASREVVGLATTYKLERTVSEGDGPYKEVRVAVSWTDRLHDATEPLQLRYDATITRSDPRLAALTRIAPENGIAQRRPLNRHPAIPPAAKDLGEGRSVFKPLPGGTLAWVFNNVSGLITGVCSVAAGTATSEIVADDIAACADNVPGGAFLLRGHVRYSYADPADPNHPADAVQSIGVTLSLSSSPHASPPQCHVDASSNAARGVQASDYYCIVVPRSPTLSDSGIYWSGRSNLNGLTLAAGGHRVCRYSDDLDGNGSIDNAEHPANYTRVVESMAQQNFLVVRHEVSCPAGQRVDLAAGQLRNTVTVNHQP